ncbi:protein TolQ [Inmirania thermothiophila]|uniref:Tol-Pal system protein TolQ n=1 Tax=Inmirania thermothiophila TaxID=1750597 RepID=A0A3N1XU59_9GAMM|nr:protein TolQ [Inmirania thermothiophila]ROR29798.1 cell division and transport-associated protein TolQ [Inmirania thermothiophila]
MNADLSILHLVTGASPLVQAVMLMLLAASVASWTIIFHKAAVLRAARAEADAFEDRFWSGGSLGEMYKEIADGGAARGLAEIFRAGMSEFLRLRRQGGMDPKVVLEGAQRQMRVALTRETDRLEHHLSFLATVGSTSPYVGLFGTVWGIMNAFRSLAHVQQATLAQVAPGIAEALVATAMGLFAAIPAVIAYNRYANDLERLVTRYETFAEEFASILQRQVHAA